MKLLFVLYLEEDDDLVCRLLQDNDVQMCSRMPLEGHSGGVASGWYGQTMPAPYHSRMIFSVVEAEKARAVMEAVQGARGVTDARHPIHAVMVDVEEMVHSGVPTPTRQA